jgi:heme exporter protein C
MAAVGAGSPRKPHLAMLRWEGAADGPLIVLCGKGVCFDTGGLDIKPSSAMLRMKKDMGGAAVMIGLADALMATKAPIRLLLLVGVVNIPIIYFSVTWWNTLHQGASVSLTKSPSMASTMLWGMLLMAMCFWMYSIAVALMRVRTIMLERERHTDWVKAELASLGTGGEK